MKYREDRRRTNYRQYNKKYIKWQSRGEERGAGGDNKGILLKARSIDTQEDYYSMEEGKRVVVRVG